MGDIFRDELVEVWSEIKECEKDNCNDLKELNLWARLKDKPIIQPSKEYWEFKVGAISWTTKKIRVDMKSVNMSGFGPYNYKFNEVDLFIKK